MTKKLLFLLFLASFSSYAQYTAIPDVNFENKLISLGIDSGVVDGKVLTSSISSLTSLNVRNSSIADLTGIQDFVALNILNCGGNKLTTLDVSKNVALVALSCHLNQLNALDISKNVALTSLFCHSNQLNALDVSKNILITSLTCYSNQITSLDVSKNSVLEDLSCFSNQLTTLNVSANIALTLLWCSTNPLTTLDVTKNTALATLYCDSNQLTTLDVSKNTALNDLTCVGNQLTTLDVSENTLLTRLYCYSNQLTTLDVSKNTALSDFKCNSNSLVDLNLKNGKNSILNNSKINFTNNPNLTCILVDDVIYSNANWSSIKDDTANFNTDCATSNLYTYIPDVNFENKLIALGIDSGAADGKVLTAKAALVTSLNVSSSNIADLTGIEDFTALTELRCRSNNLISLDVSKNVQLTDLNCPYNKLTSLDVSKNVNLIYLDCSSNQITTLDVTKNANLYYLYSNYNKLTTIDVSKNVRLTRLVCISNQLTSLDVSKNVNLALLGCENNSLLSLNLKNWNNIALDKTLLDFRNNPNLGCIEVDDPTYSNVNWPNKDASTIYSTNCTPYTLIPDVNFEKALIALGFDSGIPDGKLLTSNIVSITSLDVSNKSIADLSGIEDFVALKNLSFASNQLTRLEVSRNINLTSLVCNSNQLPKLDVSKNINLISLVCNSNQLTGLDVSKNINLTSLACNSNQLTGLNVSKNVNLKNLDCSINQLTTLDVSKNVNLISLYSNSNSLLSLNLKNGNNISFNKTLLDFKGNPNLSCIEVEDATYSNTNWSNLKDTTASYNLYCSPYTLIPDDNFERALIALGLDTGAIDGKVLRSNIASVTSLNVGSKTIYDLTGIQDFTALTSLSCYGNKLTALDLSKNVNLTYLACYGNNLATLDVSKNVKLSQLDCFTNQLTVINVSNNVKLLYFYCQENKLSNLNVTKNINLLHLSCYSNQLTTLDVSNNVKLLNFYCQSNKLTNLDVSRNVMLTRLSCNDNSLLNLNLKNGNNIALSKTLSDFRNNPNLSCIQVDDVTYSNLNWETNKDATATYNTNCNPYTFIPDVNFENKLISLGIDSGVSDGKVLTSSISSLTSLNVTNSSITDLTGVQDFVALTTLNCSTNKLISLDVSKNLALTKLYCSGNQLTNLDLSENLALNNLTCASNQLTSLNLKNNIALTFLNCATNKLTNLDVTNNTLLTTFFCHYNQLTTIDLSKNILLGYFVCYKNNLTTIDVSKNSDLYMFDLFDNQITSLDVSKNPKLTELACENNQLTYLNLKNGANTILDLTYSNFVNNPNLTCILVDDAIYSNTNWVNIKDATAGYSENCGATIVLPSDNFAVESKGETCVNENNGEISITAKETHTYVAIINGKSYPFVNNSLKVASLTPSTYTVSITITGEIFEQIFTIVIAKGATITGKSSIVNNKVAVEIIEGTAPYTVFVDGVEQFETSDSSFSIETKKGSLLQVKTAKACEGIYAKDIVGLNESVTAYPNPTSGSFEIELPTSRKEVAIKLYTLDGHLISNKTYTIENGKAQLSLENQPTGVYVAKIELDTPDYLKIIKN